MIPNIDCDFASTPLIISSRSQQVKMSNSILQITADIVSLNKIIFPSVTDTSPLLLSRDVGVAWDENGSRGILWQAICENSSKALMYD